MSSHKFQFVCAISGLPLIVLFFAGIAASGFLPPAAPSWDADRTVQHYRDHEKGIQAGAALMMAASVFYLPLTAAISSQMRDVPNLHYTVRALQLAAGASSSIIFILSSIILAVTSFRLDRPAEITQALNDMFWILLVMSNPPFMVQYTSIAYAVLTDCRPKPLFPKPIAILNILFSVITVPSVALHCVKNGPIAWNGAICFWVPSAIWVVQILLESLCLIRKVLTGGKSSTGDVCRSQEAGL